MLSIRGWKTVFVPFSLMRLFFAPKEKPVPCPTVKCPHPPHPVERTFHVSFCPLFVAGTGRKVSLESPNFQLFTLYRKFGGLTWDLTMVLSMYVWKTSGRNCVSSTGKQECQRKQFKPHFEILRASRPGRYAAARLCLEEQSCLKPTGQHSEAQAHHPLHGSVCAAGSSGWQAACLSLHTHSIVL